ncbi:uncharacterized protein A4U43_C01F3020 [Asparagus officinalis]|uniref:Hyaluronan/mRNA-binding protein domain-containing protein n=1 Tax=Asparagus officinalis TaxID=4686 RepID=A0A5P1FLK2_ASPOF|nr:uncharacterized protein A4U43_C01F3020 [Asparagus officinalis]
MPSKPLPPFQAAPRGGGSSRGGPGRGRGARDFGNGNADGFARGYGRVDGGENGDNRRPFERERGFYGGPSERDRGTYDGPRQPFRGGRRGGDGNEETGGDSERPRRTYERRSGTGRGYENKRDGAGRGNWGNATDDALTQEIGENVNAEEKIASHEKQPEQDDAPSAEADKEKKEGQANEAEEKEKEDKEMTLEEYEKIREEKRKALLALKTEERKVEIDNELKSMHLLSLKKENDPIFVKLGSDKKKKESAERDEKVKKSLSINEFLKPAEGERYYGRGRGRGRGDRGPLQGGYGGGGGGGVFASAPAIEDPGQFPTLGGK